MGIYAINCHLCIYRTKCHFCVFIRKYKGQNINGKYWNMSSYILDWYHNWDYTYNKIKL